MLPFKNDSKTRSFAWDDPESSEASSDEYSDSVSTTEKASAKISSLTEAVSLLQKSMQQKQQQRRPTPPPPVPTFAIPAGVDANLFKMIYDLGFEAGVSRREPEEPCRVCEERRRKNRIAAAEQRKRQKMSNDNDE
jgi:hypothetical protein